MTAVDDKVTPLPTALERLGHRIDAAWQRTRKGEAEWIEGSLEAMQALAEGRERFPSNGAFGEWLKANNHDHFTDHERAALLSLAGDLAITRKILTETKSRSYELIWRNNSECLASTRKTPGRGRPKGSLNKPRVGAATKFKKARELVRPRVEADQPLKTAELEVEHGISRDTFERAALAEQAAKEAAAEARQLAIEDQAIAIGLSEKSKIKLDDAIRIHKARLEKQFKDRVSEEVRRQIVAADDATRANNKRLHLENISLKRIIGERGVFTEIQFKQMLMLCHPDSSAGPKIKAELLQILVENKIRLIKPGKT